MPEPLDPARFHILTSKQIKILIICLVAFVVFVLPPSLYFYYTWAINRPSQTDREITFEIKNGQSVSQTAKLLAERGAVNSEFLFNLYVFLNKFDTNIQAGVYKIKAGTSVLGLVQMFQHGVNDTEIIFLEGWRIEEFARKASSTLPKIDYAKFVNLAKAHEGYLFPDTYTFSNDVTEEALLTVLLNTFELKAAPLLTTQALATTGLTKNQVITLASIVEREVSKAEDRPVVAGILLKRYRLGMKIDADATTQYAIALSRLCKDVSVNVCTAPLEIFYEFNWWPKDLTQQDLASDSSYNTRKLVGLPEGPICSPSISAISAVVNSVPTDYYYYLNDRFGNIHYAATLEEHNNNIATYLN
jgi:UPF0755 protein